MFRIRSTRNVVLYDEIRNEIIDLDDICVIINPDWIDQETVNQDSNNPIKIRKC